MSTYTGSKGKLNTGAEIPLLGFGTWQDKDEQEEAVLHALKAGYRHIDTAWIYGTEAAVGKAIKNSGVPRDEIFLTTKLWNHKHHPEDVEAHFTESLSQLGLDYVDLYLMHWPVSWKRGKSAFPFEDKKAVVEKDWDYVDTWKAMEKIFKSGKAKAIGISNFSKAEIENLLSKSDVVPAAHQMELHPYLTQLEFTKWNQSKGIHVTAYSPFGNSNPTYTKGQEIPQLIKNPELEKIGEKYGKTAPQTALAWAIAQGWSVLPKSKTESRIKANFEGDFKLKDEDVKAINALDKKLRFNDPSENFNWNHYADLDGK